LEEFKNGEKSIIFTTDVLSRGIDIEKVDLIINLNPTLEI
jgi:superfamily II DNA/RNA helicase